MREPALRGIIEIGTVSRDFNLVPQHQCHHHKILGFSSLLPGFRDIVDRV